MEHTEPFKPLDLQEMHTLGKEGKLWAIEIIFKLEGSTMIRKKRNMQETALMKYRASMFQYGLVQPVEPGHWKVVCPMDIISVDVFRQAAFFPDALDSTHEIDLI